MKPNLAATALVTVSAFALTLGATALAQNFLAARSAEARFGSARIAADRYKNRRTTGNFAAPTVRMHRTPKPLVCRNGF